MGWFLGHYYIFRVSEEFGKNDWVPWSPKPQRAKVRVGVCPTRRTFFDPQWGLKNPEFAYLCATYATTGDGGCPDEMIHLASAMQFLGLHCVTGAVCGVSGGGADGVTLTFYKHMVDESDRLDHVRAEQDAMLKLANMSFDQRDRYRDIHVGA